MIWNIGNLSYICTRFQGEELIEGIKEKGFRLGGEWLKGENRPEKLSHFFWMVRLELLTLMPQN